MDTDVIKGNWKQLKGKVRQQWSDISQNDIDKIEGTYDELAGLLQETYGYGKDKIKKEISSLINDADLSKLKTKAYNTAETLTDRFSNAKEKVEDAIFQTASDIKEKSTTAYDQSINYIEKNPGKAVGIAVLFGMAIQYLFRK